MEFKTLGMNTYRVLIALILICVTVSIVSVTKTINIRYQLSETQAKCGVLEKAINKPALQKAEKIKKTETVRSVDLSDQERQEIAERYNAKVEILNSIIRELEEKTTITETDTKIISKPEIPDSPYFTASKPDTNVRAVGLLILNNKEIGAQAEYGIANKISINAGITKEHILAGIFYRF
jgi:hypothetical protein